MKLVFVRHGESTDNVKGPETPVISDADLTEKGVEEAREMVSALKKYDIQKIYTSPKIRAKRTAEIVGEELGIEVEVIPGFSERDWGEWGPNTWGEVSTILKEYSIEKRFTFTPPGGESWKDMGTRLLAALEKIRLEHKENVAIFTHVGCLRSLVPVMKRVHIGEHEKFSVKTGTITTFCTDKDEFDFIGFSPSEI